MSALVNKPLMRLAIALLLLMFYSASVHAQTIDNLQTDEEVQSFVRRVDHNPVFFLKATGRDWGHDADSIYAGKYQKISWQKADLDNNGHTDLLVNGFENDTINKNSCWKKSLIILSLGRDSFPVKTLTHALHTYLFNARYIEVNQRPYIVTFEVRVKRAEGAPYVALKDTLEYAFGEFIEAKPSVDYGIRQTRYEFSEPGFMTTHAFKLLIRGDSILFEQKDWPSHSSPDSLWTVKLSPSLKTKLYGLLSHSQFPALKREYDVNWNHAAHGHLNIQYGSGKTKEIFDNGLIGTHCLYAIHTFFKDLWTTQPWKRIPR